MEEMKEGCPFTLFVPSLSPFSTEKKKAVIQIVSIIGVMRANGGERRERGGWATSSFEWVAAMMMIFFTVFHWSHPTEENSPFFFVSFSIAID